jgi:EAL domain-containing protein (putative c-di-GMP-specific phosphodiesterase class I)
MTDAKSSHQSAAGVSGYVESLKRDRDRFVALAFCAADLLIEINANGIVTFSAGATQSLMGKRPEELIGLSFMSLMAEPYQALVRELISGMTPGARLDPVPVRLNGQQGPTVPLSLMGYHLPDMPGCHFFAFRLGAVPAAEALLDGATRDSESGLLEKDAFACIASHQISEAGKRGEKLALTMVHTGDLSKFRAKLDQESSTSLMQNLGACLQANSTAGQSAGRLDDNSYGFLHRAGIDIKTIIGRVEEIFQAADPRGVGIPIRTGTIGADIGGRSASDAKRALLYTVNKFCDCDGVDFDRTSLARNLEKLSRETDLMLVKFRDATDKGKFDIAFQPIVSLETYKIHHFEALARMNGVISESPYHLITFGENAGIIQDFDLAMCRRVLDWLLESSARGEKHVIAVNVSGRSVVNSAFVSALHDLLEKFSSVRSGLIFEVTESAKIDDLNAANAFIQGLRDAGNLVCLDDFGAGSAALRYLHAFDIDIVKIDGQYVRTAEGSERNRAFLRAVIGLCRDLDVETIAEMVEDDKTAIMLRATGVQYAQGYHFGKPAFDIKSFFASKPVPEERSGKIIDVSQTGTRKKLAAAGKNSPKRGRNPNISRSGLG